MQCGNIFEIRLHEDCMIGEVIVMDMDNMTINDMTQLTLSLLMKTRIMYQVRFYFFAYRNECGTFLHEKS